MLKFERKIRNFAKKAPDDAFKAIKSASFIAYRDIIQGTPVDSGLAKSKWKIKVNKRGEFYVLISNQVNYIEYLAKGSSPQAEEGWIEEILNEIPDNIKRLIP